jgi:hypothetical protein
MIEFVELVKRKSRMFIALSSSQRVLLAIPRVSKPFSSATVSTFPGAPVLRCLRHLPALMYSPKLVTRLCRGSGTCDVPLCVRRSVAREVELFAFLEVQ